MSGIFRTALAIVAGTVALVSFATAAVAQKRVALVIGNGAYKKVTELPNPSRDAAAVERLLRASGFDFVRRADNLGLVDMRRVLREFAAEVSNADIAVVYFGGHGIEVNGTNYLIPVDATLEHDLAVEDEALPLERVNQILEPAKRLRLIILDACRDNPFVRSMKRSVASRSIGRGLAKVDVLTTDTLIAYAAKAGSTASDGSGTNSPYTLALLNHLTTPGLDVRLALGRVRDEVLKTTSNKQEPFVYGSLGGAEIALVPGKAADTSKGAEPLASKRLSEAAEAWSAIKDTTSIAVLETYAARYAGSVHADLAKARLTDLRKQEAAAAKAELDRQAERKRMEREASARAEAERQRLALLQKEEQEKRPGLPGGQPSWAELGCQSVASVTVDRAAIGVGRRESRFRAIRIHARGADIHMLQMRVMYPTGEPDTFAVSSLIRNGERSVQFDLKGWERSIERVEIVYRIAPSGKAPTICFEGLQ